MKEPEYHMPDLTDLEGWELLPEELPGRLVIRKWPAPEETEGGIVIPVAYRERPPGVAWVVAVHGNELLKPGDVVMTTERQLDSAVVSMYSALKPRKDLFIIDARELYARYPAERAKEKAHVG